MKKLLIYFFFLHLITSCGSNSNFDVELLPYQEEGRNGEWGYINLEGEIAIEADFKNKPGLFSDGYALYKYKGEAQYIDEEGKVIDNDYIDGTHFNEGLACVIKENSYPIYINTDFEEVLVLEGAEQASLFSNGLAAFKNEEGKWGYINKDGEVVIDPIYDGASNFNEGLATVHNIYEEDNTKRKIKEVGVIDTDGEEVIKPDDDFKIIYPFVEERAIYVDDEGSWGVLDTDGEKIVRADDDWSFIGPYINGYASFKEDGQWGLIDRDGEKLIPSKYDTQLMFFNGLSWINDDGEIGFIDLDREEIIEPDFDNIALPFLGSYAIALEGNDWIVIDDDGEEIKELDVANIDRSYISTLSKYGQVRDNSILITSDFFNSDALANTIIENSDAEGFNGLYGNSNVKDVMSQLQIPDNELPKNSYRNNIILYNRKATEEAFYNLTLNFDGKVSKAIVQNRTYGNGYYKRTYKETVGWQPSDNCKLISTLHQINLKGKALGKEEILAKKLIDRLSLDINTKVVNEDKVTKVFNKSGDLQVEVSYDNFGNVSLKYFFPKGNPQSS